jgi:hypothetical protein
VVPCCVFPSIFRHRRKVPGAPTQAKATRAQPAGCVGAGDIKHQVAEGGGGGGGEVVTDHDDDDYDDTLVVSYEDLITYLLHKAPGSKLAYLNFQGRNKVVYRI